MSDNGFQYIEGGEDAQRRAAHWAEAKANEARTKRRKYWIIGIAAGLVAACCIGGVISMAGGKKDGASPLPAQTTVTQQNVPVNETTTIGSTTTPQAAPPAPTTFKVEGNGNSLGDIKDTTGQRYSLTGKYRVDYTASYQFLIVEFMKSDGTDGSGFMDTINEYSNSGNVSGSAVVTLTDVSSVAVSNTQGAWSITFTKLGS
jgi:hypothetical protein